ncbi:MAG TPA: hypothetical protein ENJ20_07055, partial [Bacteroidetes bacterium]|nr:hypothetical protein [Bacteroidota bacterium]
DEYTFDPPLTSDTVICSGAEVPFKAVPRFNGEVVWFSDSTGMDTVFTGSTFWLPDFPSNPGDEPLSLTFYAQEFRNDSCFSATRSAATITILPQPDIITSDNPVICEGDTFDLNTVDVIDINGANGIITFHSSEQITPDTEVDPLVVPSHTQDTYYIASTPPGGCTDVVAVQFSLLPAPDAQIAGEELVCKNANQTLVANDTGNAPLPLSYQWNTGDTTRSITIASHPLPDSSEVIFIEMTAANGCTDSDTLTITTINNIHQVQRIVEDVSTCGGSDGAITLTPLDGLPPFTFHWGNGQTFTGNSLTLTNLEQGTYSFTITDSSPQQCDFTIPLMTVNGPGAVVAASEVVDVSCNGLSDGAIHLNVNGTNPVITWENGSNGASLENVPAGNHSVTITDGTCENVLQFVVDQPDKLTVNPVIDPPRCSYSANGSVTLYTFGGNPPYQYNWQNGLTTQQINHLPAGNYPVTITDTKGCVQEFPTLEVPAPPALFFDTTTLSQPACFGFDNGKISVKPEGGTPPYDVDWSNGGMGTTINSLAAGNFTVSIEDANGCLLTGMLSLEQPAPLTMTFDTLTNPHCKGNEDGWIAATTTGGTPPYQYIWNNDHTTEDLTNLPEGTYQVTVTDNHLCTWTSPVVTLTGPKLITVEADIQHPPCIGRNEGSITVVPNGNGSYSFDWDIDESGPSITDQAPGFYTVTITDNTTLCQTDTTFQLTTAQVLTLHVDFRHPACFGVPGGEIYLLPAGGTEPYSYQWSGTSETTSFRTMLPAGNYAASVTDAQGCIISTDIIPLYYPAPIRLDLLSFDALPCYGDSTGAIEVLATGGTGNLHYKWSTNDTLPNLNDLGPGIYTLSVYDENNCSVNEEYEITWPPPLTVEAERFITGCHILDSVCITPTGGMAPYNYSWNYSDTLTTCLTDVPVGDYTVTVTDQLGCSKVLESVKITDQASPVYIQLLPSEDSLCFGQTNGSLSVLIDGGSLPYQYIWEHGEAGTTFDTVLTVNNLAPGPYWVTITDNEGCTSVSPILTVEEGEQLTAVVASHNDVQCKGYANGAILLAVEGGFPPYGAAWTDAAGSIIGEGLSIDSLPAGIYSALITDAQQCVYQLETT